ncbi:MAG TPA: hypothetical protein VG711_02480 [Phycisphaerales bacterium]|nr:hypothetical protein [Phycisphaerales bacterium]
MSRKSSKPALYERMQLQRSMSAPSNDQESERPERSAGSESPFPEWLSAGRVVRVPIGYIFVVGAFMVLCLALAYSVGVKRGQSAANESSVNEPFLPSHALENRSSESGGGMGDLGSKSTISEDSAEEVKPTTYTEPRVLPKAQWADLNADVREKGENYFVLAETTKDGATRLAEYCRSEGLETYVIPRKNVSSRYLVIACPGFRVGERSTPVVKNLEQRIHEIGDSWKANKHGTTNLHDAYPKLYDGKPW